MVVVPSLRKKPSPGLVPIVQAWQEDALSTVSLFAFNLHMPQKVPLTFAWWKWIDFSSTCDQSSKDLQRPIAGRSWLRDPLYRIKRRESAWPGCSWVTIRVSTKETWGSTFILCNPGGTPVRVSLQIITNNTHIQLQVFARLYKFLIYVRVHYSTTTVGALKKSNFRSFNLLATVLIQLHWGDTHLALEVDATRIAESVRSTESPVSVAVGNMWHRDATWSVTHIFHALPNKNSACYQNTARTWG